MGKKTNRYVSASEIGTATYCEKALYNQINGVKSSRFNHSQRVRGNIAHEELSKEIVYQQNESRRFWLVRLLRWIWRLFFR